MPAADWLAFLTELADRADALALRWFRAAELSVAEKPDKSPVTEADQAIEAMARALVRERHPELGVLGEEQGESGAAGPRLIIDPIDGTRNFVRGIPVFGTLLAVEVGGEVVAGVASAPAMHVRWRAARGVGAFRDARRLRVSRVRSLADALVLHGNLGFEEGGPPPGIQALLARAGHSRGFGDFYQHVLVAEGAGDVAIDPVVHPWDIAALQVIVEEAGGMATSLRGERSIYATSLVTSNGALHEAALRALQP
ncbi:MAG TPA: inositol monophosphatase family protein [Gemmatimonadales bacterium]|nr:inositol monophosphatase family protein [Gemmatimonadales bacterium]